MAIQTLQITNFRNLVTVDVDLLTYGLNIISGLNGSGKTSLLEAIYYLSHNRSFRTVQATSLINHQQDKFALFAQISTDGQLNLPIGVERYMNSDTKIKIANQNTSSVSEIAQYMPIRLINSQSYHLFDAGPQYRRKFLDWGLFYQNNHFIRCWRDYERVLKQRNIILKERKSKSELEPWTNELIRYGLELDAMRRQYITAIVPLIVTCADELLNLNNLMITYYPGWDDNLSFQEVLAMNYADEMRAGYTLFGPHRADLEIAIDMILVKHYLSRGQQKLLICAMILAQGILLAKATNKQVTYLIDDLPAELDLNSRQKLLSILAKQNTQIFLTAIDSNIVDEIIGSKIDVPKRLFHVEHGQIANVSG